MIGVPMVISSRTRCGDCPRGFAGDDPAERPADQGDRLSAIFGKTGFGDRGEAVNIAVD